MVCARQAAVLEPLLVADEVRRDVHLERVIGLIHRPQSAATLARLERILSAQDEK